MSKTHASRLEDAIRDELAPILRDEGFRGSGRTFRRIDDVTLHLVNVQGSQWGPAFYINLAVHPIGVAGFVGGVRDPLKMSASACVLTHRLADGRKESWDHDGSADGMRRAVRDAAATYVKNGRRFFEPFRPPENFFQTIAVEHFEKRAKKIFGHNAFVIRLAIMLAELRSSDGRHAEAAAFAKKALSVMVDPDEKCKLETIIARSAR